MSTYYPSTHVFHGCTIWCDGGDFVDNVLNPSMWTVERVLRDINECGDQFFNGQEFTQEEYGQHTYITRDNSPDPSSELHILSVYAKPATRTTEITYTPDVGSEVKYVLKNGTLLESEALVEVMVQFMMGDDILDLCPFELELAVE